MRIDGTRVSPSLRSWGSPAPKKKRRLLLVLAALTAALGLAGIWKAAPRHGNEAAASESSVEKAGAVRYPGKLPATIEVDPLYQSFAEEILRRHPTRFAAVFLMDMRTRRPLVALVAEHGKSRVDLPALVAPQYPMASLAKMTTAWAAMSDKGMVPSRRFRLRGKAHTLYKGQLDTLRGDTLSLARAFAISCNPVFGQIGVHHIGAPRYVQWLDSMGFNHPKGLGEGVPSGRALAPRDTYNLAELSSGFIRTTFVSPVHAAMLASKFAGGADLLPPVWESGRGQVDTATGPESPLVKHMIALMRLTADSGTARRAFDQVWEDEMREGFEFGGKTGSLDGDNPKGHYEWFAGFARRKGRPDSGVAIAALAVNEGRQLLPGNWLAVQVLGAWRRHFGQARDLVPAGRALAAGPAFFSEEDQDALKARPTFRPVKRKGGKLKKKRKGKVEKAAKVSKSKSTSKAKKKSKR